MLKRPNVGRLGDSTVSPGDPFVIRVLLSGKLTKTERKYGPKDISGSAYIYYKTHERANLSLTQRVRLLSSRKYSSTVRVVWNEDDGNSNRKNVWNSDRFVIGRALYNSETQEPGLESHHGISILTEAGDLTPTIWSALRAIEAAIYPWGADFALGRVTSE